MALLFDNNTDVFEDRLSSAEALSEADYELWRQKGPVGSFITSLSIFTNQKGLRMYLLNELQEYAISRSDDLKMRSKRPLSVVLDNETRWLSQHYMIHRTLKLRSYFQMLVTKFRSQWEEGNTSKKPAD
jgi:hypothetical protein